MSTDLGPAERAWIAQAVRALELSDRGQQQALLAQATHDYQRSLKVRAHVARQKGQQP